MTARDEPVGSLAERVAARGTRSLPLILTHGWPAVSWDYRKLLGPLSDPAAYGGDPADSFELIGFSLFAPDLPLGADTPVDEEYFNVALIRRHPRGGHFPALEQPQALIDDIRAAFRGVGP